MSRLLPQLSLTLLTGTISMVTTNGEGASAFAPLNVGLYSRIVSASNNCVTQTSLKSPLAVVRFIT